MIEITRAKSTFQFHISPKDARTIDYRKNKHGARWKPYQTFDTEEEARQEILKIESERGNE